jgi:hypothetical protein
MLLTLFGIALCFLWRKQGDIVHGGPMPVPFSRREAPVGSAAVDSTDDVGTPTGTAIDTDTDTAVDTARSDLSDGAPNGSFQSSAGPPPVSR